MDERKMTRQEKKEKQINAIKELMKSNGGVAKTSQLYTLGLDYRRIQNFVESGMIERIKNGYYTINYRNMQEEDIITALFSDCVLCMESALYYYHYINTKPFRWTIAVDKNTSKSRFQLEYPIVQPYYTEPDVLLLGVEKITLGSSEMSIYSKERMICDILKYEDRLVHEDLQQALRAYIMDKDKDIEKLLSIAKQRKVLSKVRNQIGVWL